MLNYTSVPSSRMRFTLLIVIFRAHTRRLIELYLASVVSALSPPIASTLWLQFKYYLGIIRAKILNTMHNSISKNIKFKIKLATPYTSRQPPQQQRERERANKGNFKIAWSLEGRAINRALHPIAASAAAAALYTRAQSSLQSSP